MAYTQVLYQSGDFHGLFSHEDYSLKMQVSWGEGHIITNDKHISFLKKTLFLERGEGKEKERGRNTNVWLPLACSPPHWGLGPQPRHVLWLGIMCSDWESNRWPFGFQASTQSTEPQQPELIDTFLNDLLTLWPGPVCREKGNSWAALQWRGADSKTAFQPHSSVHVLSRESPWVVALT